MSNTNCAICYDNIENTCDGYTTQCNHTMHNTCLTHWLFLKDNCPICRNNLCGKDNDEEIYNSNDDENFEIEDIQVRFDNEVYTSNYSSVLESIKELIFMSFVGKLTTSSINIFTSRTPNCVGNTSGGWFLLIH